MRMRNPAWAILLWSCACGDVMRDKRPASFPESELVCTSEDTWENFGQPLFDTYCFSCHEKIKKHARVQQKRERIARAIDNGTMPKDDAMSADEKRRVLAWLACGAP